MTNNPLGRNQWTNALPDAVYSIRFALAQVLLDKGATYDEIRAKTGLSNESIARISKGERQNDAALVESLRKTEVSKLTLLAHTILDSIGEEDIAKASLLQRITGAAILTDKRELLAGKATARVEFEGVPDEELEQRIRELKTKIEGWEQGKILNAETIEPDDPPPGIPPSPGPAQ